MYNINQTIALGFYIYAVKIVEDLLIIAGLSDKIFFYKDNGSQYLFDQSIQTAENHILKISFKDGKLSYGCTNQTFNVY